MIVEIVDIEGLWDTSTSWFAKSRSLVQVEFQGIYQNSKPNDNVKNPKFNELFIFPFDEQSQENHALQMKLFISVFVVEGKGDVPKMLPPTPACAEGSPGGQDEKDQN